MRSIEKVHVFRCVGKADGRVIYRLNVVAGGRNHAERTCNLWLERTHKNLASVRPIAIQWQVKVVKMDNPIYMEWEDGA